MAQNDNDKQVNKETYAQRGRGATLHVDYLTGLSKVQFSALFEFVGHCQMHVFYISIRFVVLSVLVVLLYGKNYS